LSETPTWLHFAEPIRSTQSREAPIAKNQNTFAKRQREQEKKRRQDDKRTKKDKKKDGTDTSTPTDTSRLFMTPDLPPPDLS